MAWEGIEQRLKKHLKIQVSFPAGTIWLPDSYLSIDDWLTSLAQTDEELRELELPRIAFLQNRWPLEQLVELEWDNDFSDRRAVLAMYVRQRAYIVFSGWSDYQILAAIEPKNKPSLYRELLGNLLRNPHYVPEKPSLIHNHRPDLVPDIAPGFHESRKKLAAEPQLHALESPNVLQRVRVKSPTAKPYHAWRSFLTEILVGWISRWLGQPEIGFPHEETPHSISTSQQTRKTDSKNTPADKVTKRRRKSL